jgi:hypothetical protein
VGMTLSKRGSVGMVILAFGGAALAAGILFSRPVRANDTKLIEQARLACMHLATEQQNRSGQGATSLGDTANVSSDPAENVFEFKWPAPEVYCKGFAGKRVITGLSVSGKELACRWTVDPVTCLESSECARCAVRY